MGSVDSQINPLQPQHNSYLMPTLAPRSSKKVDRSRHKASMRINVFMTLEIPKLTSTILRYA